MKQLIIEMKKGLISYIKKRIFIIKQLWIYFATFWYQFHLVSTFIRKVGFGNSDTYFVYGT